MLAGNPIRSNVIGNVLDIKFCGKIATLILARVQTLPGKGPLLAGLDRVSPDRRCSTIEPHWIRRHRRRSRRTEQSEIVLPRLSRTRAPNCALCVPHGWLPRVASEPCAEGLSTMAADPGVAVAVRVPRRGRLVARTRSRCRDRRCG